MTDEFRPRSMATGARNVIRPNDSASLWNHTLSPGWTSEEFETLRRAIMRIGCGNWRQIIDSGCLPGKSVAQLNLQTQRMLGQQSTAEYGGLHIDPLVIGRINSQRTNVIRKGSCIVNTGAKISREAMKIKIAENKIKYEVSESEWKSIVLPVPSENINFSGLSVSAAATSTIIAESHLVQLVGGLDVSKLDINERAILLAQKRKQLVLLQRELSRVQRDIKAKQSICISSTSTTTHKHTAHTTTTTSLSQLTDMEVSKTSIASKSKKSSTFTKLLITNTPVSSLETTLPVNDEELARMLAKEEEERYLLEQGLLGEENGDHLEYDDDADDQDFTTRKKRGKSGGGGVSQGSSIKSKRAKIKSSS